MNDSPFPSYTIHFTLDKAFKFQGNSDSKLIHTHTKDKAPPKNKIASYTYD